MTYALDPLRDSRHRDAKAARECADWVAWLELERKAPRTIDAYEQTIAFLLRAYPDKTIQEFTPGDLMHLLRGFPEKARHIRRYQLNLFFEWAYVQRIVDENPMRRVPKIKLPRQQIAKTFTEIEQALLEALPDHHGPLMSTLFLTGIRLEEAQRMQAKHVEFARDRIVIPHGKGDKGRFVPIRRLTPILADWFLLDGLEPDDYLWPTNPAGRAIRHHSMATKGAIYNWWRTALRLADVKPGEGDEKRTFHSTRHTFATNYLRRGGKLERLRLILGHESIKTTMDTYVHLDLDDVYADLELIEG